MRPFASAKSSGRSGLIHDVAEHDGDLTTLGLCRWRGPWSRHCLVCRTAVSGSEVSKFAPHCAQKKSSEPIPWPQDGQKRASAVPHFTQNFGQSLPPHSVRLSSRVI